MQQVPPSSPLPPPYPPMPSGMNGPGNQMPPPPMYFPPAPMIYPPAPSRAGTFARAIFTTLAVAVLGCSVSLNFYFLAYQLATSGTTELVDSAVLQEGDEKNTIAVVPIEGVITEATVEQTNLLLKSVENDSSVKALVLQVDSPGGSVTASDQIYERLLRYKRDHGKPVVVSMGGLATSGGYYISCAADHVVAQRTTWTGNIGVLLPRYDLSELGKKYGIADATITSSNTPFKNAGSMFKTDTPEQTAYWQGLADKAMGVFKDVVGKGRKLDPTTVDAVANGQVYTGEDALKLKLVDSVGYFDTAVADASKRAGLAGSSYRVVKYSKMTSMWDALGGSSSATSTLVKAKIGQLEVGIDQRAMQELLSPRPQYLWRGQ